MHSACQFCLQYKPIQRFCKTWHELNFNFTLIMKFNLENRLFYLCPNVDRLLKNVLKRQIRANLKKKNWRMIILRWLGRKSVQNVARTRKWGGFHSNPPWSVIGRSKDIQNFRMDGYILHTFYCEVLEPPMGTSFIA